MTVSLVPMSSERLRPWIQQIRSEYIESRIQSGDTLEAATANADASFERSFVEGVPREGHLVYDVLSDDRPVGYLWLGPQSPPQSGFWWVWDIAIDPAHQRRGYGREALLLGEAEVAHRDGKILGLNVFGFNVGARALYESLGYETTAVQMRKVLG
ncbi:MAG: GNAT family N-acetyltransferase [Propionibacteriaceae bacterium]